MEPGSIDVYGRPLKQDDATLNPIYQSGWRLKGAISGYNPEKEVRQSAQYRQIETPLGTKYELLTDEEWAKLHADWMIKMKSAIDAGKYPSGKEIAPTILDKLKDVWDYISTKGATPEQTHKFLGLYSSSGMSGLEGRPDGTQGPEGTQVAQYDPMGDYEDMLLDLSRRQRASQGFPASKDFLKLFPRGGEGFKDLPEKDLKKLEQQSMLSANQDGPHGRAMSYNPPVYQPGPDMTDLPKPANDNYTPRVQQILQDYLKVFKKDQ